MGSIADELITRGWTQGTFADDDGRVCLLGACEALAHGVPLTGFETMPAEEVLVFNRARVALSRAIGNFGVIRFNDAPGRTFDEVLRVAKTADEILDA